MPNPDEILNQPPEDDGFSLFPADPDEAPVPGNEPAAEDIYGEFKLLDPDETPEETPDGPEPESEEAPAPAEEAPAPAEEPQLHDPELRFEERAALYEEMQQAASGQQPNRVMPAAAIAMGRLNQALDSEEPLDKKQVRADLCMLLFAALVAESRKDSKSGVSEAENSMKDLYTQEVALACAEKKQLQLVVDRYMGKMDKENFKKSLADFLADKGLEKYAKDLRERGKQKARERKERFQMLEAHSDLPIKLQHAEVSKKQDMTSLVTEMDNAEKNVHFGSEKFAEVSKQLKAMQEDWSLTDMLGDCAGWRTRYAQLEQACNAYLDTKQGKELSEKTQRRVDAVSAVLRHARAQLQLLEPVEEAKNSVKQGAEPVPAPAEADIPTVIRSLSKKSVEAYEYRAALHNVSRELAEANKSVNFGSKAYTDAMESVTRFSEAWLLAAEDDSPGRICHSLNQAAMFCVRYLAAKQGKELNKTGQKRYDAVKKALGILADRADVIKEKYPDMAGSLLSAVHELAPLPAAMKR